MVRILGKLSASYRRLLLWLVPAIGLPGFWAGYLSGGLISIHVARKELREYAQRLIDRSDIATVEARAALQSMHAIKASYCSHRELDLIGFLLFRSRFLRDAGHMKDGRIDCSTLLGSLDPPVVVAGPSYAQPDETRIYPNTPLFEGSGLSAVMLQEGNDYVTLSPNLMASVLVPRYSYTFSVNVALNSSSAGEQHPLSELPLKAISANDEGEFHRILYVTRCSTVDTDCVTTYAPIGALLRSQMRYSIESAGAGGFAGVSLAMILALLLERQRSIERRFRRALHHCRLSVAYQPIVDLKTGRTTGAEGLARWTDVTGETVPPSVFLPIAERLGLMADLTQCVVTRILDDLAQMAGVSPEFRISFNVSAPEVAESWLLPFLRAATSQRGLSLKNLALEITEGATADYAELSGAIQELRESGLSVYLDDFGTGYSSLGHLESLGVDCVKIDKIFTRAIETASVTSPILPQIVKMAGSLRLQAIVEGVETEQQVSYLKLFQHALYVQGWFFGRPMPALALSDRLLAERYAQGLPVLPA